MKKIIFLLLINVMFKCGLAQSSTGRPVVPIDSIDSSLDIELHTSVFIDSILNLPLDGLRESNFVPLSGFSLRNKIPEKYISKPAYLLFSLKNNTDLNRELVFFPGMYFDRLDLYKHVPGSAPQFISGTKSNSGFIRFSLPAKQSETFLVKMQFCKIDYNKIRAVLVNPAHLEEYRTMLAGSYGESKIASYILSGVLLMMILFTLVNFFFNAKIEFLYHCFYSACMFFLIFFSSYLSRRPGLFSSFFRSYLDLLLLMAGTIFYLAFIRKFLETKQKHTKLEKLLKAEGWVLFIMMSAFTYVHFASDNILFGKIIENSMKIFALLMGGIFIFMGIKQKDSLLRYISLGSAVQIFFSVISLYLILANITTTTIFDSAFFYFELGVITSIFFFLYGLTYKNRKELVEKTKEKEFMKLEVEKKEFENQLAILKAHQEERDRISADMHDDLGAGMTSIRLFSELAKTKMGDNAIPEIEKISASANELLNKMNAIIWSMNSSDDTLGNMVAYIRSYALEYLDNTGIKCSITIPETLPRIEVPGMVRRNVFLVVKEALNNIVKHSGATVTDIILQKEPLGISLVIHDNGKGIDFEKLRQFGNGLKNMKKRMEDVGIEFTIENRNGTTIKLYRQTR